MSEAAPIVMRHTRPRTGDLSMNGDGSVVGVADFAFQREVHLFFNYKKKKFLSILTTPSRGASPTHSGTAQNGSEPSMRFLSVSCIFIFIRMKRMSFWKHPRRRFGSESM